MRMIALADAGLTGQDAQSLFIIITIIVIISIITITIDSIAVSLFVDWLSLSDPNNNLMMRRAGSSQSSHSLWSPTDRYAVGQNVATTWTFNRVPPTKVVFSVFCWYSMFELCGLSTCSLPNTQSKSLLLNASSSSSS